MDAVHASGGGLVLLPSGAYNISGSVAVRGDYILLRGVPAPLWLFPARLL